MREHPEDGEGWDVIAPVYYKLGRFGDAANAYARAARLRGETVRRLAGFAESAVFAADGIVTEQARAAYEKISRLEPGRVEPRFWLALAKEQDGKLADALADYKGLLADAPADAPWRAAVEGRVAEVSRRLAGAEKVDPRGPGPTAEDVAAAEKLSPEDRARMIAQMVDGLAERLKRDGRDLAGWQRLINAYAVLGREQEARKALAEARSKFPADETALARTRRACQKPRARLMTRKQRRATFIALSVGILSAAVLLVAIALRDTIVFFHTPKEVTEKQIPAGKRIRLGGLVADGSVKRGAGTSIEFAITDTVKTISVSYTGLLPDLFREGQGVVAEGKLDPAGRFLADTVLAKHDENYMPPEVAKALKEQGVWKEPGKAKGSAQK